MIDYIKIDGMLYPKLLPTYNQTEFGKYGRMRFEFLKEYNEELLFRLLMQNKLIDYLIDINERIYQFINDFEQAYLKDKRKDYRSRLTARACAEEMALKEIIYT